MGMNKVAWIAGLVLALAGCVNPVDDRFCDYNEDALLLFRQGNYRDARESFQAALDLKPGDPALMYDIGECYDRLGDAAKAERFYQECLLRAPNHEACRHALAVLLLRQKRRDDAAHMIEDWLAREPKLAGPYAEDGWFWHQAGDLPRAQARLQQALEIDPHDTRALTELALVYEEMRRPDRALVLYERVLEREPDQVELKKHVQFLLTNGAGRPRPE
jgi:tetratricopeptide (TPR) repeat protein